MNESPFANASLSVHAHATENEGLVSKSLRTMLPEGVALKVSKTKGHYGNPITVIEARVEGKSNIEKLLQRVFESIPANDLVKIKSELTYSVDDSCNLYLRFDKQRLSVGELSLAEGGDSVHLRLKIAVYPARKEAAVAALKRFLQEKISVFTCREKDT
ncbi:MAG: RNA-binding domain-containing protein [Candidatus Hadarchaeota archaeon]